MSLLKCFQMIAVANQLETVLHVGAVYEKSPDENETE